MLLRRAGNRKESNASHSRVSGPRHMVFASRVLSNEEVPFQSLADERKPAICLNEGSRESLTEQRLSAGTVKQTVLRQHACTASQL
jgi:hypothetical protein